MSGNERSSLLVLAPSRRATTETFIRANLAGMPFRCRVYVGDEWPLKQPDQMLYASAIVLSKVFTRLRWLRLASLPASLVAWWLIRRHRPDGVLVEFGFEAVRVMEACAWSGVPLLVHFRGSDASARNRLGLLRERYRRLLRLAAGVIVKSRPMAATLLDLGASEQRLLISPSGADARLFHGANPAQAPPVLLAVGRFVPKKGPLHTIRAFGLLQADPATAIPGAELWMVGDGPLLAPARALVEHLALQASVRCVGAREQAEVAALMRQVRAFVQHSLVAADGDSEGSPVAVMEAQLSGLPVVATRHAGIPEVVIDAQSGFLVAEGDERGMAAAMGRLLRDPQLAADLGDCGRRRIEAGFTVDHHLQQLAAFVDRMIQNLPL